MTAMLTILEGYLYYHKGIIAARLDGGTDRTIREVQLTSFNDPNNFEYSVFLISTRAGGVGINLQAADTVIIYDRYTLY